MVRERFKDELVSALGNRTGCASSFPFWKAQWQEQGDWFHQEESRLVAWTHKYEMSSVVYLQPGDGPLAFTNEHYRKLISNTLYWLNNERVLTNEE
jgi:hypothetical protein